MTRKQATRVFLRQLQNCDYLAITRRRRWHPTPVLLPGKFHGWRSLVGCSPWGRQESDMTEQLHFPFSLSCIGEGNGNPLQCSCLENPKDGGAWRIPGMGEPGGLLSMGLHRVGHDWSNLAAAITSRKYCDWLQSQFPSWHTACFLVLSLL